MTLDEEKRVWLAVYCAAVTGNWLDPEKQANHGVEMYRARFSGIPVLERGYDQDSLPAKRHR